MLSARYDSKNKKHLKTRNKKHLKTRNKKRSKNISRKTKTRMRRKKIWGGGPGAGVLYYKRKCMAKIGEIIKDQKDILKQKLCGFFGLYNDLYNSHFFIKLINGDEFETPKLLCGQLRILARTSNVIKNISVHAVPAAIPIMGWFWGNEILQFSQLLSQDYTLKYKDHLMHLVTIYSFPKDSSMSPDSIISNYNTAVFIFNVSINDKTGWLILYLYYNGDVRLLGKDNDNTFCDGFTIEYKVQKKPKMGFFDLTQQAKKVEEHTKEEEAKHELEKANLELEKAKHELEKAKHELEKATRELEEAKEALVLEEAKATTGSDNSDKKRYTDLEKAILKQAKAEGNQNSLNLRFLQKQEKYKFALHMQKTASEYMDNKSAPQPEVLSADNIAISKTDELMMLRFELEEMIYADLKKKLTSSDADLIKEFTSMDDNDPKKSGYLFFDGVSALTISKIQETFDKTYEYQNSEIHRLGNWIDTILVEKSALQRTSFFKDQKQYVGVETKSKEK